MAKIIGYGAPTKNTPGRLGQEYFDKSAKTVYTCTNVINKTSLKSGHMDAEYEWANLSGGGSADVGFKEIIENGTTRVSEVKCESATEIEFQTFRHSPVLETVDFPSVTIVTGQQFSRCEKLQNVNLPKATNIESEAFSQCNSLSTITLPSAITIGDWAFYESASLKRVDLPSATSVGMNAFCYTPLSELILRSKTLCDVRISAIVSTGIITIEGMPTGTGFVYVPTSLYESYVADFVPKMIELAEMGGMTLDEATATYIATAILRKIEDHPDVPMPGYYYVKWLDGDTTDRLSINIENTQLFKVSDEVPSVEQLIKSFAILGYGDEYEFGDDSYMVSVNEALSQQYPGVYIMVLATQVGLGKDLFAAVVYSADEFSNFLGQPVESGIYFTYHNDYVFVKAMSNDDAWIYNKWE